MNKTVVTTRSRVAGAAMVEFAIVLPLLLMIFFGLVEIGRGLLMQHSLVRHVETAARYLGRSYQGLNADCSTAGNWGTASAAATQLAIYGNEAGSGPALIYGMSSDNLAISVDARTVPGYGNACIVRVAANVAYPSIFGDTIPILGIAQPTLRAESEERYVGE